MTPYYVVHPRELKPRALLEIHPDELQQTKQQLADEGLVLVETSRAAIAMLKLYGDPLNIEIQLKAEIQDSF